jgi:hypothetical protein
MLRGLDIDAPGLVRVHLAIICIRRGGRMYHRNRTDFPENPFRAFKITQVKRKHEKWGVMHFMGAADAYYLPIILRGIADVPSQEAARPGNDKLFHAIKIQDREAFSKANSRRRIGSNLILCILFNCL